MRALIVMAMIVVWTGTAEAETEAQRQFIQVVTLQLAAPISAGR